MVSMVIQGCGFLRNYPIKNFQINFLAWLHSQRTRGHFCWTYLNLFSQSFFFFSFSCLWVFWGAAGRVNMTGRVNMPAADHCRLMAASVSVTSSSPIQQWYVAGMFTCPAMVSCPATSQNTQRQLKLEILYENKFKAVQQKLSCVLCKCKWVNEFISQHLHGYFSSYPHLKLSLLVIWPSQMWHLFTRVTQCD